MLGDPLDAHLSKGGARNNERHFIRAHIYALGAIGLSSSPRLILAFSFHFQRVFIRKILRKLARVTAYYIR